MVNDTPHGEDGVFFNTTNEDRVQSTLVPMIEVNDIISLPKGQAFVLVNGSEIWKIRIPLVSKSIFHIYGIKKILEYANFIK
jgi:hypothetical protein